MQSKQKIQPFRSSTACYIPPLWLLDSPGLQGRHEPLSGDSWVVSPASLSLSARARALELPQPTDLGSTLASPELHFQKNVKQQSQHQLLKSTTTPSLHSTTLQFVLNHITMASRSLSKALRSSAARQVVAPAVQKRTLVTALSAARAGAQTASKATSASLQQVRGVKTIDFAGHKEKVFGKRRLQFFFRVSSKPVRS
jgi:hypothetical protein